MSFETVELWRPRRDPARHRGRVLLVLALIAGSLAAAFFMRRPLLLPLGLALALGVACARRRPPESGEGPPGWGVLLPRRWVPRHSDDRRAGPQPDRRRPGRRPSAAA